MVIINALIELAQRHEQEYLLHKLHHCRDKQADLYFLALAHFTLHTGQTYTGYSTCLLHEADLGIVGVHAFIPYA
jgi:hypothetical protein